MKKFVTLALIATLLGFSAVNAAAAPFTLWENFPQDNSSDTGFYTGAFDDANKTLTDLIYTSDYNWSLDGKGANPEVKRTDTSPWIQLKPSDTLSAVLYAIPDGAYSLHVSGDFSLKDEGTVAYVSVGLVLLSDLSQFTKLFWTELNSDGMDAHFDKDTLIDPDYALVFNVSGAPAYLQGTIDAVPVPVPPSLLLLGSGLLGLAGWRRLRKS